MRPRRSLLLLALALVAACGQGAVAGTSERIIVSGASGQLGGLVVEALLARGVPASDLILVSRTPEELVRYAEMGASTRFGDFMQPESLDSAYAGGTKMLLISINTLENRPGLHANAVDAAVRAGVRHIAYTSIVDADANPSPLAADHRDTEAKLRESGVAWTMLRNSIYMDGLLPQARAILEAGSVTVAPDETKLAYVTRADCAAAAAAVLATPGHENRIYEITGPAAIGVRELAQAVGEVSGRPIPIVEGDAEAGFAASLGASAAVVGMAVAELTGRPAQGIAELLQLRL